ncbi:MAG: rSAM/selenodomain-associated transferase 2 [Candidatus Endobugula sp.]
MSASIVTDVPLDREVVVAVPWPKEEYYMMQLSIIVPVLNEATTLVCFLESLKKTLSITHSEIIVVDGGSQDNTVSLAQTLVDKVLLSEKGRAKQMNLGAKNATGKTLLFLHSDTFFPVVNEVSVNEVFPFISQPVKWGFYPIRLSGRHFLFRVIERMMNVRSRLTSVATGDQCFFVDKVFFDSCGGFSDIPLMEDVELSKRLRRYGSPYIPPIKVITDSRRWEKNGILTTVVLMWYLRALYFFCV